MARNSDNVNWNHDGQVVAGVIVHTLEHATHIELTDAEATGAKAAAFQGQAALEAFMVGLGAPRSGWWLARPQSWRDFWRTMLTQP